MKIEEVREITRGQGKMMKRRRGCVVMVLVES